MDDEKLQRYSRQIVLPEIGLDGQESLDEARVLIIGAGGLGSPVAIYLSSAGVGHLTIVDDDDVDLTNLQRQILFQQDDIGHNKAESARTNLLARNPHTEIIAINRRLDDVELVEQVQLADVVVDASDNFATRFQINRACVQAATPLVSGAAIRFEGQLAVFCLQQKDAPCYACLYAEQQGETEENCASRGVFAPLVGVIGSAQAVEALKILLNIGEPAAGRLLLFDAKAMTWDTVRVKKDPQCAVCG